MPNWRNSISQNVGAERVSNLNDYVSIVSATEKSPIDQFYSEMQNILSLFPPQSWTGNNWIGSLSSIAIVSIVENYYRQVFSKILKVCIDSQKKASGNNINLGSVIWHPSNEIERGAFEHTSLASSDNINKTSRQFIDFDLKQNGLNNIFLEFDKICELRHGIVHSSNVLAGKNGIALKLNASDDPTKINIGFAEFQEIMAICNALVVDSNKALFAELSRRWATSWRNSPCWDSLRANVKFKEVWSIFYSKRDHQNGTIPEDLTWLKCRNLIVREFNI